MLTCSLGLSASCPRDEDGKPLGYSLRLALFLRSPRDWAAAGCRSEWIGLTTQQRTLALAVLLLILTGCGARTPAGSRNQTARIDPNAPAAAGHPALPLPEQPTPLTGRSPKGLYATEPSPDTLARLSTGTLSPDGRFRAVLTPTQGAWITRVDGAWIWQINLPAPPAPKTPDQPVTAGPTPPPPPPPPAPKVVGPLQWTPISTLLFLDSNTTWQEVNPTTNQITPLPAALQGTRGIRFSPDGQQVLYYKGTQLITAGRDGSQPKLVGENLVGHWAPDGKLVTSKVAAPTAGSGLDPRAQGMGKE